MLAERPDGSDALLRVCAKKNTDWRVRRLIITLCSDSRLFKHPRELAKIEGDIVTDTTLNSALREAAIEAPARSERDAAALDPAVLSKVLRDRGESLTLRELALEAVMRHFATSSSVSKDLIAVLSDRGENASLRAAIPAVLRAIDPTGKEAAGPLLGILGDIKEEANLRLSIPPAIAAFDPQPVKLAGMMVSILKNEHEIKPLRLAVLRELRWITSIEVSRALDEIAGTAGDAEVREQVKLAVAARSAKLSVVSSELGTIEKSMPKGIAERRIPLPRNKPATVAARVGATDLPGRSTGFSLDFEPRAELRAGALRTVERESLGFHLYDFDEPPDAARTGYQVDWAGRIIADALAKQLAACGFEAIVEFDKPADKKDTPKPGSSSANRRATADVFGNVHFDVDHFPGKNRDQSTASLEVKVKIVGIANGKRSELFERSFREGETITGDGRAGRYERGKKAASAVLARFVEKLLLDPELEQKLVAFARSRGD